MPTPGTSVRLRSSATTSTGQIRENNEDTVRLWVQDDSVLAIVADGMGGAAAGEEASRLAVEAIQSGLVQSEAPVLQALDRLDDDAVALKMREIIRSANADIMRRALADPELKGMGTTVTLALVRGLQAIVAHVGDSRAYLVSGRDRAIRQITADHSYVEALVAAGHITQEQAEAHPMRNVLYRALGQNDDVDVDVYHARLRPGDRVVLCSDGLTRHVRSNEIAEITLASDDPDVMSQRLIDLANHRGGEDNVSVAIIVLERPPDAPDLENDHYNPLEDDTLVLKRSLTDLLKQTTTTRMDKVSTLELPGDNVDSADDYDDWQPGSDGSGPDGNARPPRSEASQHPSTPLSDADGLDNRSPEQ